ncbi:MAG: radical SAM protein, partial [Burkholderiaceae bacterium]|nr:radical SAM protein [Burkholderiaceae bacterium]
MQVFKEHFIPNLDPLMAASVFKRSVHNIEMALSSYCNRRCPYCPDSIVDRISKKYYMSDELFINIMTQLRSINYSGVLAFHRYNEPLADKAYALARMSSARTFLPNAVFRIFTNGDYLTADYIRELVAIG